MSAWSIPLVTDANEFLRLAVAFTQVNYDLLLIGWTGWSGGLGGSASKSVQSSVLLEVLANYTLGADAQGAHDYLTGTKLWTITDSGGV